ncbi:cytotoxic T-lymphocyte protein 4 [Paramormyrops kingsleyae]|uniref:Cytotoxic T-lymphocyte protein 4-like n=1 Tax=Paramormyrops kingsleyae TaxID=1676925 RepID=A0A3B3RF30_9TELE|nr:cytotoxic T-lymphocyte protein 4-like [Paramormyrops kingsleyae]
MIILIITLISLWPQEGRALHVFQPYRTVGRGGEAVIRCSYELSSGTEELHLALYRGQYEKQEMCASTFNTRQSYFETEGIVKCRGEISSNGVNLTVTGLKGVDTDLYFCALEVLFPPPYLLRVGNGTIVYIEEEPDCPAHAEKIVADPEDTSKEAYVLPLILFAFVVIIIVIIAVINNIINMNHRRKVVGMPPVASKTLDCRFGYENFL